MPLILFSRPCASGSALSAAGGQVHVLAGGCGCRRAAGRASPCRRRAPRPARRSPARCGGSCCPGSGRCRTGAAGPCRRRRSRGDGLAAAQVLDRGRGGVVLEPERCDSAGDGEPGQPVGAAHHVHQQREHGRRRRSPRRSRAPRRWPARRAAAAPARPRRRPAAPGSAAPRQERRRATTPATAVSSRVTSITLPMRIGLSLVPNSRTAHSFMGVGVRSMTVDPTASTGEEAGFIAAATRWPADMPARVASTPAAAYLRAGRTRFMQVVRTRPPVRMGSGRVVLRSRACRQGGRPRALGPSSPPIRPPYGLPWSAYPPGRT